MSGAGANGAIMGRVVGYAERCGPSSTGVKALIQVGTDIIDVTVEFLQYEYISKECPVGSIVTVWPQDGKWHFEGKPRRDSPGSWFTGALKKAGERTADVRKGLLGPDRDEISAEKLSSQVDTDLNYIKSSIGAIDMGVPDEEEHIRQVEQEYLSRTNDMLEEPDLSRWRTAQKAWP